MFERHEAGERCILVHIDFTDPDLMTEYGEGLLLAESAGAEMIKTMRFKRTRPEPKYFLSSGKVECLAEWIKTYSIELVIINHTISPAQERELEKSIQCRVLGRTGLILDIFAKRARTFEGKLQVELAQLKYMSTRLVRGWTHLERQKGGGIGMTGPGETQLELDKRMLRLRVKQLKAKLEKVRKTRELGRKSRQKSNIYTVALVGYTNAGKSTLFNQLTQSNVYAKDQLFATLDPTLRRLKIDGLGEVVLVDTVGFIRDLPHDLVEAFKATLEESAQADLLLHVIDASHPDKDELIEQVNLVLKEIGADKLSTLNVYNKIDALSHSNIQPHVINKKSENNQDLPESVWISALKKQGFDLLLDSIFKHLSTSHFKGVISIAQSQGGFLSDLHQYQAIVSECFEADQIVLELSIDYSVLQTLARKWDIDLSQYISNKLNKLN